MTAIETIICCTDFSATAARAFAEAATIARLADAKLCVLHVVPPRPQVVRVGMRGKPVGEWDQVEEVWVADEEAALRRITSLYGEATDATFEPVVRHGFEAVEILRCADERKAGLIVLGARGVGTLTAIFAGGSVADKVVKNARVPVLVVPG